MIESNVYHLWLMPQADSNDYLSEVVRKLSRAHQTRLFDPHITLVGGITGPEEELVAKTEKLASNLIRIMITPQEVQYLNEFYRSLFLAVTPTESLINANKLAKQLFELPLNEEFMPHLSLLYGDFSVIEKERIKGELDSNLLRKFNVDRIVLIRTNSQSDEWTSVKSFTLKSTN
jgi:2'-5' RNA ligase